MRLYHGSYVEVSTPNVMFGRKYVDFGQGFYLTRLRGQVGKWAKLLAGRKPDRVPVLNVYVLDETAIRNSGFRYKVFEKYDLEWLYYVVDCRNGGRLQRDYDMVEGGVANDNVIDTVEDFENGVITATQALGQLQFKKVNHQLCIHSQKIINAHLRFLGSEVLSE